MTLTSLIPDVEAWRALFEVSCEVMLVVDEEGYVVAQNPSADARCPRPTGKIHVLHHLASCPVGLEEEWPNLQVSRRHPQEFTWVNLNDSYRILILRTLDASVPDGPMARFSENVDGFRPQNEAAQSLLDRFQRNGANTADFSAMLSQHSRRTERSALPVGFDLSVPLHGEKHDRFRALLHKTGHHVEAWLVPLASVSEDASQVRERKFLRQLLSYIDALIFVLDADGVLTFANHAFQKQLGAPRTTLDDDLSASIPHDVLSWVLGFFRGNSSSLSLRSIWSDPEGRDRVFQCEAHPIHDVAGQVRQVLVLASDVTELVFSLREKETLLREVHHRVKNNLQIVSSLLNLQIDEMPTPESRALLEECGQRVRSMALVHEQLYSQESMEQIDFSEYARHLTLLLRESLSASATVEFELTRAETHIEMAMPLGLILNELLTNAFKHGCHPDSKSQDGWDVRVQIFSQTEHLTVLVEDKGPGFPPGFRVGATRSTGMVLLSSLTRQLRGQLELREGPGGWVQLRCPTRLHQENLQRRMTTRM